MFRRFASVLALGLAGLFLLAGCAGYQLGPVKPKRMDKVATLAVSTFKNRTLEPRLEVLLANTVIKQLHLDGTYKLVREKDADALLEAEIQEIDRRPARNLNGNVLLAREYTLTLRVRYTLTRRVDGQLLEGRTVTGQTSFFASGSSLLEADVNQDERQAIPLAAEDLAQRLVSQIAEGW